MAALVIMASHDELASAFEFAKALARPEVRAEIAKRGYVSGRTVVVGRDTRVHHDAVFRVWRDDAVPGGWTGEPVVYARPPGHCPRCGEPGVGLVAKELFCRRCEWTGTHA
jgi:hypothetical protein